MEATQPSTEPDQLTQNASRYVLFRLCEQLYATPAQTVSEMLLLSSATALPGSSPAVRGVINLRGRVLPLVDLRKALGLRSLDEELAELRETISARAEDHERWIAELERCIQQGSAFTLPTDPHRCKFGQWYDEYEPSSPALAALLKKLDAPHKRLHAVANRALGLLRQDRAEAAQDLLAKTRAGVLQKLIALLAQLQEQLHESSREIAMVVQFPEGEVAFSVDRVEAVDDLVPEDQPSLNLGHGLCGSAFFGEETVFLADLETLASAARDLRAA